MTITKQETISRNKLRTLKVIKIALGLLEIKLYSKQFDGVWLFVQKISSAFRLELAKWDQKQQFLNLTRTTVAKIKIIVLSIPIAPTTAKKIMRAAFIPPGGGGGRGTQQKFHKGRPRP